MSGCDVDVIGVGNRMGGCDVDVFGVGNCHQIMCYVSHTVSCSNLYYCTNDPVQHIRDR
jgi:hypothetical protein